MRLSNIEVSVGLSGLFAFVLFAAAYVTHLLWSIKMLLGTTFTVGKCVLAGIGAFLPPVGALHGVLIWLGSGG